MMLSMERREDGRTNPMTTTYATDRSENEPCERGTVGCSVNHTATGLDSQCETW